MFSDSNASSPQQWERQTLQKVLLEHITEQRRARRWSIFFKLMLIVIVFAIIFGSYYGEKRTPLTSTQPHTAMIDISGEISADDTSNADDIRSALEKAFKNPFTKGIILRINSPGGSPVQARLVYDSIRNLRTKYPDIKVYAVIEELGASAAYLIASAADEIYADQTSLVGSIGAKMGSFGFVDAMGKMGIERRLYTTGKHKGLLDPFSPQDPEEVKFIHEQLEIVLQAFLDNVREGRGNRLNITPNIYSGYIWSGVTAKDLGLIDGFGSIYTVAREIIKTSNIVDYSVHPSFLDRFATRIGASMAKTMWAMDKVDLK